MNEKLLQFIWQFQYFQRSELRTTQQESLQIIKPGRLNADQGPDFSEAIIKIGSTIWAGNIELHIRSSDWDKHAHSADPQYANIILHVVWEDDSPVVDRMGNLFPTIELRSRVPLVLMERYRLMMDNPNMVSCYSFLPVLSDLEWDAWKERLVAERLQRRAEAIISQARLLNMHWDEVLWQSISANFGIKVNRFLFEEMAKSIPFSIINRHRKNLFQIEALLFGQSNLLHAALSDPYPIQLQKEFQFLKKKYGLEMVKKLPAFLRMRPATFPTIRLAQLAKLIHQSENLFSTLKETLDLKILYKIFLVEATDYWETHYRFDMLSKSGSKRLGKEMTDNIMINTVIPILFAYGLYSNDEPLKQRSIQWLEELKAEENKITINWKNWGIKLQTALDSQALLELTNHYCLCKHCLSCGVGNKILKNYV